MRVAVLGTGGVGGYFGARLWEAGHEVAFLARGAHLEAIRRGGLLLESIAGDVVVRPARAAEHPADVGPVDVVLVCVKAWQVPEAAASLGPLLGPGTFVVPLQNGVESHAQVAAAIGAARVVPGLCRLMSYVAGPGAIRHAAVPPDIEIGERPPRPSDRVAMLVEALRGCRGVSARVSSDIDAALWTKFLFIASFSGVGALTGRPAGEMRAHPETRAMMEGGMREIEALARASGVRLADDVVARTMAYVDSFPPDTTASMQRDILGGRPSELESQSGAVVRLATAAGVAAPIHGRIYAALLPSERKARAR